MHIFVYIYPTLRLNTLDLSRVWRCKAKRPWQRYAFGCGKVFILGTIGAMTRGIVAGFLDLSFFSIRHSEAAYANTL